MINTAILIYLIIYYITLKMGNCCGGTGPHKEDHRQANTEGVSITSINELTIQMQA